MNRPLDATRRPGASQGAPKTDADRPAPDAPSREEVEVALARLVDAVLPDPRSGRRNSQKRAKARRAL